MIKIFIYIFLSILFFQTSLFSNTKDIRLKFNNEQAIKYIGFLVAKEKGFYKKNNIELKINEDISKRDTFSNIHTSYDFSFESNNLILEQLKGGEYLSILSLYQNKPLVFLSKNPKMSFFNKTIAIKETENIEHLKLFMTLNTPQVIYYKENEKEKIIKEFIDEKIDFIAMNSFIFDDRLKNEKLHSYYPREYGFEFYDELLYTTTKFYKSNRKLVDSFYNATVEGFEYAFNNIDYSVRIFKKYKNILNINYKKINDDKYIKQQLIQLKKIAFTRNDKFGEISEQKIKSISKFYKLLGYSLKERDISDNIYSSSNIINAEYRLRPPEMIVKDNLPYGPLVDILESAALKMNKTINWKFNNVNKSLKNLENGDVDIVPRIFDSNERRKFIDYVGPINYFNKEIYFYKRKDDKRKLESYADLSSFRIGIIDKSHYFKDFDTDNNLIKVPYSNYKDMANSFINKDVDLVASYSDGLLKKAFQNKSFDNYKRSSFNHIKKTANYYAVSKKTKIKNLEKEFSKTIEQMINSGEVSNIYSRHKNNLLSFTQEEKKWIEDNPQVKLGTHINWPPYFFKDNEKNEKTITMQFLNYISVKTGLSFIQSKKLNWNESLDALKNKEIDLIPSSYYLNKRENFSFFTNKYSKVNDALFINKDTTDINTIKDLKNKKVGIVKSDASHEAYLYNLRHSSLIAYNSTVDVLFALERKEIDAFIGSELAVKYLVKDNLISNIKTLRTKNMKSNYIHMMVSKDKLILKNIIDKVLSTMPDKKSLDIHDNWIDMKVEKNDNLILSTKKIDLLESIPFKELGYIVLVFIIISLIFLILFRRKSNKFSLKVIGALLTVTFLSMIFVLTVVSLSNLEKIEKNKNSSYLSYILKETNILLEEWADKKKNVLTYINSQSSNSIKNILEGKESKKDKTILDNFMISYNKIVKESGNFLIVYSKDIKVLYSNENLSSAHASGIKICDLDIDTSIKKEHYIIPPQSNKNKWFIFLKPMYKDGEIEGFLALVTNPKGKFDEMLKDAIFLNSGETYTINEKNEMLNSGRFTKDFHNKYLKFKSEVLSSKEKTFASKQLVEKKAGFNADGYYDYRGVEVVGVWKWNKNLNIGLITEIDKEEALGAFYETKLIVFIIVFSILLFTMVLIAFLFYISYANEKKLTKKNKTLEFLLESFDKNVSSLRVDSSNNIAYISQSLCDLLSYEKEEVICKPLTKIFSENDREFQHLESLILNKTNKTIELSCYSKHNKRFDISVQLLPEEKISRFNPYINLLIHDITVHREIESLKDSLEIKVAERTIELQTQKQHIIDSINYASLIQKSLIPEKKIFENHFKDSFTIWKPKDTVGGDIYLIEELRHNDEFILMVIDCTGHGVHGAFLTMLVKAVGLQIISKIMQQNKEVSPALILKEFNKLIKMLLKQDNKNSESNAGFDGGVLYFNGIAKELKYAGAKTPLYILKDKRIEIIKGDKHSIGYKNSDINYVFSDHNINLEEGMSFYMFTDGYFEQLGGKDKMPFGKRKFKRFLEDSSSYKFSEQKEILLSELERFRGLNDYNDDITGIGFKL